jgi:hypothetical protein
MDRFDDREVLIIKDFGIPYPDSFQLMLKNQLKGLRREMKKYRDRFHPYNTLILSAVPPKNKNIFKNLQKISHAPT